MQAEGLFQIERRRPVPPGQVRLTRLNIYSGLYVEWASAAVLVDPAKVPGFAIPYLEPDLIVVSHESMDHFDPRLCTALLGNPRRRLLGSWAVVLALTDHLPPADPRWTQIIVGVPGCRYGFGDLHLDVHRSMHCEYAVPLFFEIHDATSGRRILDAIDSAITPEMRAADPPPHPDVLIVPAGIALGTTPATAWQMAELIRPLTVVASHFTRERDEFLLSRPASWPGEMVHAPAWHDALVLSSGNPRYASSVQAAARRGSGADDPLAWMAAAGTVGALLPLIRSAETPEVRAHLLYALTWALARGGDVGDVKPGLAALSDEVQASGSEPLMAAWLLAWGVCLRCDPGARPEDLDRVRHLLSPADPYISYWVLECWGRAALNPRLTVHGVNRLREIVGDPRLWVSVGVRRKLMWEVERLVRTGLEWPDIARLLADALADANPDVRLLAFRMLPIVNLSPRDRHALLGTGLTDPHEDVLEEAVAAHIAMFDRLTGDELRTVGERLSALRSGPTYHVRERANALAELLHTRDEWADAFSEQRQQGEVVR